MNSSQTTTGKIKIIQSNLLHCKLANGTLCRKFLKKELNIALLQEPYLYKNKLVGWNKVNQQFLCKTENVHIFKERQ